MDRYELYGVQPAEHEVDNSDTPEQQKVAGTVMVYSTNDKDEAMKLFRNGGFNRGDENGPWVPVTWAKDNQTGRRIGDVPSGAQQGG